MTGPFKLQSQKLEAFAPTGLKYRTDLVRKFRGSYSGHQDNQFCAILMTVETGRILKASAMRAKGLDDTLPDEW